MTDAYDFELPITSDDALRLFIAQAFGVKIPDRQICPNHVTPWRAFRDAYFGVGQVAIWEASRGFGGKSFLLALLGLTIGITKGVDVNILGGSGEQSERVHEYMGQFWDYPNAPTQLLMSDPAQRHTRLTWGNHVRCLMASSRSVRGPHPVVLLADEVDEIEIPILDAALGQPMRQESKIPDLGIIRPLTILSSTHQYADKTMTEVLKRGVEKGWPRLVWCFRESAKPDGWLSWEDIEEKRSLVTAAMWENEYELQAPNPQDRAIDSGKVEKMFIGPEIADVMGEELIFEEPVANGRYTTGADWARSQDFTVIMTFRIDVKPIRLVAYLRINRRPWPMMIKAFDQRVTRYRGVAYHDQTGAGDVVDGYISVLAGGIIMVGRARSDLLTNYIAAIEREEIESPRIRSLYSEHLYASVEDVYSGGSTHHLPDTVAAGALAYNGAAMLPVRQVEMNL